MQAHSICHLSIICLLITPFYRSFIFSRAKLPANYSLEEVVWSKTLGSFVIVMPLFFWHWKLLSGIVAACHHIGTGSSGAIKKCDASF